MPKRHPDEPGPIQELSKAALAAAVLQNVRKSVGLAVMW